MRQDLDFENKIDATIVRDDKVPTSLLQAAYTTSYFTVVIIHYTDI